MQKSHTQDGGSDQQLVNVPDHYQEPYQLMTGKLERWFSLVNRCMPTQADHDKWRYKICGDESRGSTFHVGNAARVLHTLHGVRSLHTAPETAFHHTACKPTLHVHNKDSTVD